MLVNLEVLEQNGYVFAMILTSVQAVLFFGLLLLVSIYDGIERSIPDRLQILIASLTLLQFSFGNLLGIIVALPYLLIALLGKQTGGIGGGDVKLAGSTGIVLGLPAGLTASIIGLTGFVLYGFCVQQYRKYKGETVNIPFPVGPFLAVGSVIAYFMKIGGLIL